MTQSHPYEKGDNTVPRALSDTSRDAVHSQIQPPGPGVTDEARSRPGRASVSPPPPVPRSETV